MNLIIVESPTKAKTLSRFLGKEYLVEATMGHIKDLPKSKLSVDVENNFKPDYQVVADKSKAINAIKKSAKGVKGIYIATDPDREGEAIAQHVEEILLEDKKLKLIDSHRIVFHEITKGAVEEAIAHPGKVDKNRVNAQIARRVLDRLVGYKLSPLLWKKIRRGLSAGRVQTVTVRLIVEREREIEAFKPVEYWEIYCDVKSQEVGSKTLEFRVNLIKIDGKKMEIGDESSAKDAVSDLEKFDYKVLDLVKKEVNKSPYPPFTTSTLTQAAARYWGWSAKRTMSTAQKLYEEGLITYHRTDSVSIAKLALTMARSYIEKEYGKNYLPEGARIYKTKSKSAQEAHESIRPTDVKAKHKTTNTKYSQDAGRLYQLIWNRFVACQMANSVYNETRIDVEAYPNSKNEGVDIPGVKKYLLRASGQVMKFDGWRKVIPLSKDEEPELPEVNQNDPLQLIKVDPLQKFTQPPARFNEASLIKTLEKLGIGRPSTYAPTIHTIQVRNYVEKEERVFRPTSIGITTNDFLIKNFPGVFNYQFTAGMEDDLDNIAHGKRKWQDMMGEFYKPFEKKVTTAEEKAKRVKIPTEKVGRKCPTCKKEGRIDKKRGELVIRIGRFGKFISCEHFPECKHTEKFLQKIGMKCPECEKGDVIVKNTRKRRKFFGCSRYPECEFASWKDPKNPKESKSNKK